MKYVSVPETFEQPSGEPFVIQDPDSRKVRQVMEEAHERGEETVLVPSVEATFIQVVSYFVGRLPWKLGKDGKTPEYPLDFDGEGNRADVLRACRAVESANVLALERAPYEWVLEKLKEEGPTALGATCRVLYEAFNTATDGAPGKESPSD